MLKCAVSPPSATGRNADVNQELSQWRLWPIFGHPKSLLYSERPGYAAGARGLDRRSPNSGELSCKPNSRRPRFVSLIPALSAAA